MCIVIVIWMLCVVYPLINHLKFQEMISLYHFIQLIIVLIVYSIYYIIITFYWYNTYCIVFLVLCLMYGIELMPQSECGSFLVILRIALCYEMMIATITLKSMIYNTRLSHKSQNYRDQQCHHFASINYISMLFLDVIYAVHFCRWLIIYALQKRY